jgi:3-hydroxyisobutyrate dehydrogenase-like beta-hydroxyacid dehydrogenase
VTDPSASTIAFIGFGEAAQAFVAGWARHDGTALKVYDIKTEATEQAVRDGKLADYARFGVRGRDSSAEALGGADVVFSLVTADQAFVAAVDAARHLGPGALFLDGNSCAPETKKNAARVIETAGGRYVDVAIMAPVHPALHKVPLLLSGPHAEAATDALRALDMEPQIADGSVGTASSIKMVRSVMMKGLEALVLECVLAGQKAGVADVVLDSLDKTYPGFDWKKRSAYMLERVMTHGVRRAAEMREVARTVEDLGLSGAMAQATVEWQQRVGELGLDAGEGAYAERAEAILKALDAADADAGASGAGRKEKVA